MYSRCHLIAGRFSRVRYRSATESTESAAAATVARFPSSLAPPSALGPVSSYGICSSTSLLVPPSLLRSARALSPFPPFRLARTHVARSALFPILGSLPPRDVERVRAAKLVVSAKGTEKKKEKSKEIKKKSNDRRRRKIPGSGLEGRERDGGTERAERSARHRHRPTATGLPDLSPLLPPFTDLRRCTSPKPTGEGGDTFGTWTRGTHGSSRWIRENPRRTPLATVLSCRSVTVFVSNHARNQCCSVGFFFSPIFVCSVCVRVFSPCW